MLLLLRFSLKWMLRNSGGEGPCYFHTSKESKPGVKILGVVLMAETTDDY